MCLFLKERGENVADNKKAKGRREGGDDDNDDGLGKNMDIIWTRMMMQRSCLLDWMMVGILLIGEGVDIVELGRQDSAAASNERPTRNTKMASRKTKVAEKGHQKRIRHRDDDSVCFSG